MPLLAIEAYGWALACCLANRLLDGLDGAVARIRGPTDFGGYADIVADPTRVRKYDGLRIYKSVGAALQDLTIAAMCVTRARERSFGTELPAAIAPVLK